MEQWYKKDLAQIHDLGYGDLALYSARNLLTILAENDLREGLIVDLGCGSGISAQVFAQANYRVLGVDISDAMIEIARIRVPNAEFRVESLFETEIPPCIAVTVIGEGLNYLFDRQSDRPRLMELFDRIDNALVPGGAFVFDIAEPGQVSPKTPTRGFAEGPDWIVLVEKEEEGDILKRRIITLHQIGEYYRRDEEVHLQRLYQGEELAEELRQRGFQVRVSRHYGEYELPIARVALIAQKPKAYTDSG